MTAKTATTPKLTDNQWLYVNNYCGDIKETAKRIGLTHQYCRKLNTDKRIVDAIRQRRAAEPIKIGIASRQDRQAWWSHLMQDDTVGMGDRLKASELLGKSEVDFTDRHLVQADAGAQPPIERQAAIDRSRARAIQINAHVRTVTPGEGGKGNDDIDIYPH